MAKKGLGRGLGSLFEESTAPAVDIKDTDSVVTLRISQIEPNKNQPRKQFDKEKIELLADSIKEHGVIQPIIVTKSNDMYKIVAGERRWRAAKKAGLSEIPVVIRNYTDIEIAQIALIENLQREDLNPIEEAIGYRSLIDKFNMTQEEVSETIGKSRSAIANSIRLLSLDEPAQSMLIAGEISSGHARALLSVENSEARLILLEAIKEKGLNVRQAEALAKQLQNVKPKKERPVIDEQVQAEYEAMQDRLSSHFGTKVKLTGSGGKRGKIEIEYFGNEDLERILGMLM